MVIAADAGYDITSESVRQSFSRAARQLNRDEKIALDNWTVPTALAAGGVLLNRRPVVWVGHGPDSLRLRLLNVSEPL